MWNRTKQSDQEAMGPSSQHQSLPPHSSKHPSQPMQPVAQDKSCSSGKLEFVCMRLYNGVRENRIPIITNFLAVLTIKRFIFPK